jgi:hypothetical protein
MRHGSVIVDLAAPNGGNCACTVPGETVARALHEFRLRLRGTHALLIPWVQDFSFTIPYDADKVQAQVDAARRAGAKGFMLWNANGVYTDQVLEGP